MSDPLDLGCRSRMEHIYVREDEPPGRNATGPWNPQVALCGRTVYYGDLSPGAEEFCLYEHGVWHEWSSVGTFLDGVEESWCPECVAKVSPLHRLAHTDIG